MRDWSRENLAWAAGLIEGEGCVTRQVTTSRSERGHYWQVKVTSTDLDVLQRLEAILQAGAIYKQKTRPQHKPAWQFKIYRQPEVYAVLAALFCFMGQRRSTRFLEALADMGSRPPWGAGRRPRKRDYQSLAANSERA